MFHYCRYTSNNLKHRNMLLSIFVELNMENKIFNYTPYIYIYICILYRHIIVEYNSHSSSSTVVKLSKDTI